MKPLLVAFVLVFGVACASPSDPGGPDGARDDTRSPGLDAASDVVVVPDAPGDTAAPMDAPADVAMDVSVDTRPDVAADVRPMCPPPTCRTSLDCQAVCTPPIVGSWCCEGTTCVTRSTGCLTPLPDGGSTCTGAGQCDGTHPCSGGLDCCRGIPGPGPRCGRCIPRGDICPM
jgi:hypothetical protein